MGMANRQPTSPAEYAAYRERFHNWGRWGADDERGENGEDASHSWQLRGCWAP